MKIGILGAGAMGSLVGAHLKKGGAEVYLVDPYMAHMQAIAEKGVCMELEGQEAMVVMPDGATTDAAQVGICDVVVLLAKGVDTENCVKANSKLFDGNTVILTLQNGLGNVELLKNYFPPMQIGFGVLNASATLFAPGKIIGRARFENSPYSMYVAPALKETSLIQRLDKLVVFLDRGGMPAKLTDGTEAFLWDKLYLNAMYNLPCALLRIAGEDFMRHREGRVILREIARELCLVATAKGFPMDPDEYWEKKGGASIDSLPLSVRHYTSAVHDAVRKRKTEVDFINGAICREGEKLGIPTPYNEMIWRLAKVMEDTYDLQYVPECH
jgi:2-dehydropantoate 2-reductase